MKKIAGFDIDKIPPGKELTVQESYELVKHYEAQLEAFAKDDNSDAKYGVMKKLETALWQVLHRDFSCLNKAQVFHVLSLASTYRGGMEPHRILLRCSKIHETLKATKPRKNV